MQTIQQVEARNSYGQGWGKQTERDREACKANLERLNDLALDRGCSPIEFAVDDVCTRPRLSLRSREMATIAALTALGNAQPQLKVQIHHALNVGCTRTQVVKAILQAAAFVGFAAVLHSTTAAKEVFQERDARGNELNHA